MVSPLFCLIKTSEVFEKSNLRLSKEEYGKVDDDETAYEPLKSAIEQFLKRKRL